MKRRTPGTIHTDRKTTTKRLTDEHVLSSQESEYLLKTYGKEVLHPLANAEFWLEDPLVLKPIEKNAHPLEAKQQMLIAAQNGNIAKVRENALKTVNLINSLRLKDLKALKLTDVLRLRKISNHTSTHWRRIRPNYKFIAKHPELLVEAMNDIKAMRKTSK